MAYILWHIFCGIYFVAYILWHIFCGIYFVAYILWHIFEAHWSTLKHIEAHWSILMHIEAHLKHTWFHPRARSSYGMLIKITMATHSVSYHHCSRRSINTTTRFINQRSRFYKYYMINDIHGIWRWVCFGFVEICSSSWWNVLSSFNYSTAQVYRLLIRKMRLFVWNWTIEHRWTYL